MAKKETINTPLPFQGDQHQRGTSLRLYTDGASRGNPGPAGAGIVIQDDNGILIEGKKYLGVTTNNTAEYEALIHGLSILKERALFQPLKIFSDSQLMVRQLNGRYKIKQPHLRELAGKVHELLKSFPSHEIIHIPRGENRHADKLANEAIDTKDR